MKNHGARVALQKSTPARIIERLEAVCENAHE
jgi:hypothetical protein